MSEAWGHFLGFHPLVQVTLLILIAPYVPNIVRALVHRVTGGLVKANIGNGTILNLRRDSRSVPERLTSLENQVDGLRLLIIKAHPEIEEKK